MLKKKYFYCLYKHIDTQSIQVTLLAQKNGVISLDYLFEKAAGFDLEVLFTPEGGSWEQFREFFSHLIQKNNFDAVLYLEQRSYNEKVTEISQAEDVYSLFEEYGKSYPEGRNSGSLREKFLKI